MSASALLFSRAGAVRYISGGAPIHKLRADRFDNVGTMLDDMTGGNGITVSFKATEMSVMESCGAANLVVQRTGHAERGHADVLLVDYETRDGTARAGDDYLACHGPGPRGCHRAWVPGVLVGRVRHEERK